MTSDEFRHLIEAQSDEQLLGPCLHDDIIPYVFDLKPAAWDTFRDELAMLIGASRADKRALDSRSSMITTAWEF